MIRRSSSLFAAVLLASLLGCQADDPEVTVEATPAATPTPPPPSAPIPPSPIPAPTPAADGTAIPGQSGPAADLPKDRPMRAGILVVNGVYLGVGSFEGVGDAGDLLRYGAPRWTLIANGLVCVPTGLYLWHGLGTQFGLGEAKGRVYGVATVAVLSLLMAFVLVELLVGTRR